MMDPSAENIGYENNGARNEYSNEGYASNDYFVVSTTSGIPRTTEERIAHSMNRNSPQDSSKPTGGANLHSTEPEIWHSKPQDLHTSSLGHDNASFVYSNENLSRDFSHKPHKPYIFRESISETKESSDSVGGRCCSKKRIIIAIVVVIFVLLAGAVIALGVILAERPWESDTVQQPQTTFTDTGRRTLINGEVTLTWLWNDDLANENSSEFQRAAKIFEKEIDNLYRNFSSLRKLYRSSKVTEFKKGSVHVLFDLIFIVANIMTGDEIVVHAAGLQEVVTQLRDNYNKTNLPLLPATIVMRETIRIDETRAARTTSTSDSPKQTTPFSTTVGQTTKPTSALSSSRTSDIVKRTTRPISDNTTSAQNVTSTTVRPTTTRSKCTAIQFTCGDGSCIALPLVCDGMRQCPQGDDESLCVRQTKDKKVIEVKFQGVWTPVCAADWDHSLGDIVCKEMGEKSLKATSAVRYDSRAYLLYDTKKNNSNWHTRFQLRSNCPRSEALILTCNPEYCGMRASGLMKPLIIGGDKAALGDWPWMASMQINGLHDCGATLIHPQFVVTAAHCVRGKENLLGLFTVIIGGTKWKQIGSTAKKYHVEKAFIHEDYDLWNHDIALLQLFKPVVYTDYIRPLCLPRASDVFTESAVCFVTGWGRTSAQNAAMSDDLRELKVKLWSRSKCNRPQSWNGQIREGLRCAGYEDPMKNACNGDSGGPLTCLRKDGRWYQVGVASFVSKNCKERNKPPVFDNVLKELDWIKKHTECVFKCKSGKCLYQKELICNRKDDCGDNSDEGSHCPNSVSCTFEHPFLCGYQIEGWYASSGGALPMAAFDHTLSDSKGKYMISNGDSKLLSREFSLDASHCLRFFYHTVASNLNRGRFYVELVTYGQSTTIKTIWNKQGSSDMDRWTMAALTLAKGKYRVRFRADQLRIVSLDDVLLTRGECSKQPNEACQIGEKKCAYEKKPNCVKNDVKCNIAYNCQFASDESVCPEKMPKLYTCNFEDNHACGIRRKTSQLVNGWHIQDGSGSATLLKKDHTFGSAKGHFFYSTPAPGSEFNIEMWLYRLEYCLTVYYKLKSVSSQLHVRVNTKNGTKVVTIFHHKDHGVRNKVWNKAMFHIPRGHYIVKLIVSLETYRVDTTANSFFAIDDIKMIHGQCQKFECPQGAVQCGNSTFCIHSSQICDRQLDCPGQEDEKNCACKDNEYKCSSGLCISKNLICNRKNDCPAGDDEGKVCDKFRTASCTFEHRMLCGYTITSNGDYEWQRHSSNTPSIGTGPSNDHTFQNTSGHYVYVEGNNGVEKKETSLITPTFSTPDKDSSISFFYHIRGNQDHVGYLQLSWKGTRLHDQALILPPVVLRVSKEWQFVCRNLRKNSEMTFTMMAIRGKGSKADLAIDDIKLSHDPCPGIVE